RYMKKVVVPELGVKCKYCHVMNDYASDEKEAKKVSREMMRMVQGINKNTMQKLGHRDVSCWDCHRGVTPPSKKK
ncbi:MAG: photosynthetic reaction center cytochrome c subunit family protein, partial [Candidatus Marinimicrobia bacterium]|nr:photosynthetic reaction center cytochrome c subunit family protein [Candidatus Neomarinimicrobiota bacterium]